MSRLEGKFRLGGRVGARGLARKGEGRGRKTLPSNPFTTSDCGLEGGVYYVGKGGNSGKKKNHNHTTTHKAKKTKAHTHQQPKHTQKKQTQKKTNTKKTQHTTHGGGGGGKGFSVRVNSCLNRLSRREENPTLSRGLSALSGGKKKKKKWGRCFGVCVCVLWGGGWGGGGWGGCVGGGKKHDRIELKSKSDRLESYANLALIRKIVDSWELDGLKERKTKVG